MEILLFLHKIVEVFTEYFKELEEESIRDNFVVIYELLDEMMDFGYPQTTESKILQEYVLQEMMISRLLHPVVLIFPRHHPDTSPKNPTNSKPPPAPQSQSQTPSPGAAKASATAKTKSSSTSSNRSTCSSAPPATSCARRFSAPSR